MRVISFDRIDLGRNGRGTLDAAEALEEQNKITKLNKVGGK